MNIIWIVYREHAVLPAVGVSVVHYYPSIEAADIVQAASLAQAYLGLCAAPPKGGLWRLNRLLALYRDTRSTRDVVERVHQYCRIIEGVVVSEPGKGKSRFKSRTELFIGPGY